MISFSIFLSNTAHSPELLLSELLLAPAELRRREKEPCRSSGHENRTLKLRSSVRLCVIAQVYSTSQPSGSASERALRFLDGEINVCKAIRKHGRTDIGFSALLSIPAR